MLSRQPLHALLRGALTTVLPCRLKHRTTHAALRSSPAVPTHVPTSGGHRSGLGANHTRRTVCPSPVRRVNAGFPLPLAGNPTGVAEEKGGALIALRSLGEGETGEWGSPSWLPLPVFSTVMESTRVESTLSERRFGPGLVRALAPVAALIILAAVLSILAPGFLTLENILSIGPQAGIIGLMAIGQTAVIITGAIDLSVGSVMTFSGIVLGLLMASGMNPVLATLCCVATGAVWGVLNGVITAYGRIPAFITTLGSLGMAKGLALILAGGQPIFRNMAGYRFLGQGKILGIPVVIVVLAAVALAMHLTLSQTRFGRHIYATGGNKESARLSGVNVDGITVAVFTMSGALAGLAAALMASRLSSAQLTSGDGAELDAIAATVIGGCSLMGGQGNVGGTVLGIMLMGVLRNGLSVMSASQWAVSPFWQQVIIGAVIVGAVLFDQWLRRKEARA